jgi:outer membrane protein assembly factor BamB
VNSSTLEEVWGGRIGLTDGEFLAEQKEKGLLETLNPKPPKQVVTMGSKFVCENEKCYAVTAEGILVVLDITKKQVQMAQVFPKQDIILNNLYKPIITNGNIIFATGNSEFAIFNIEKQAIIGQSTFSNEETASMFDINLVKEIYSSNGNVLISHLNGIYAFNVVQGRPLWNKNLHIDTALISGNYIIFFENKTQKLVCMHIATGEAKWIVPLNSKQTQVSFLQIVKNENDYSLFVGTKNGVEVLSFEDGSKKHFLKMNLGNVAYSFTHNEILYYINKSNIYKVK